MLNYLFLILGAIATTVLYLLAPSTGLWWLLPIYIGAVIASIVVFLILLYLFSIIFLPKRKKIKKPKAWCSFMIWLVMDWVMSVLRVKVTLTGENLLPNEPCVLVSNHRSDFDPMTVLSCMRRRRIAYISKESNFKIPIVGNFIHHAGFLSIDRGNGLRALRTLKQAGELMHDTGVDIGIYPEGTRSKTGELLRFKTGAFILAKRADAPIAVMTTVGTDRVFKNFPLHSTQVDLKIIAVIDRETVNALTAEELRDKVQTLVEENLKA